MIDLEHDHLEIYALAIKNHIYVFNMSVRSDICIVILLVYTYKIVITKHVSPQSFTVRSPFFYLSLSRHIYVY